MLYGLREVLALMSYYFWLLLVLAIISLAIMALAIVILTLTACFDLDELN